jgi:ElaB/YqjD/DUF883 family membrane-anchored ribosome-binding protein
MHRVLVCLVPALALVALPGCGPATPPARPARPPAPTAQADHGHAGHDHDHDHDEPTSLADGVEKLESLAEDLADKLAENAGEAADDAVHDIGHLLEAVREQARKFTEPADDVAALQKALDELEECFGKVDEAFHAGDEKVDPKQVLGSLKERIDAAFKAIRGVL